MVAVVQELFQSQLQWSHIRYEFILNEDGSFHKNNNLYIYKLINLSIKKLFCIFPSGLCKICPQNTRCNYLKIFPSELSNTTIGGIPRLNPIILKRFPLPNPYKAQDIFAIDIILLGEGVHYKFHALEAPHLMTMFRWQSYLNWVSFYNAYIYQESSSENPINNLFPVNLLNSNEENFTITTLTPFMGKYKNKVLYKWKPDSFLFHLIHRYKLLTSTFGTFHPSDIDNLGSFSFQKWEETKVTIPRHSQLQNQSFQWIGLMGRYKIKTNCPKIKFLLFFGEMFHLGKNTHIGYGSYSLNKERVGE